MSRNSITLHSGRFAFRTVLAIGLFAGAPLHAAIQQATNSRCEELAAAYQRLELTAREAEKRQIAWNPGSFIRTLSDIAPSEVAGMASVLGEIVGGLSRNDKAKANLEQRQAKEEAARIAQLYRLECGQ